MTLMNLNIKSKEMMLFVITLVVTGLTITIYTQSAYALGSINLKCDGDIVANKCIHTTNTVNNAVITNKMIANKNR